MSAGGNFWAASPVAAQPTPHQGREWTGQERTGQEQIPATPADRESAPVSRWTLENLSGRLSELSGAGPSSQLSLAFSLLVGAQQRGEPVAWITTRTSTFFPPDAAVDGVDLAALPVIFVPDAPAAARAAERLGRSGAFGLLVLDLVEQHPRVPAALQSRLAGLAVRHDMVVLCLTNKQPEAASLGALVSLRCQALREEVGRRFSCRLQVLKDKRHGPEWEHTEWFHGPGGLR